MATQERIYPVKLYETLHKHGGDVPFEFGEKSTGRCYHFRSKIPGCNFFQKAAQGEIYYGLATLAGYILLLAGGKRLSRHMPSFRDKDPFGRRRAGFPQERRRRKSPFSLHFEARYEYKGQEVKSWINILNPRRGVLILGSPGSGKSWFIIEPCVRQLMEKGMAMFVYDYKYDALSRLAYNLFSNIGRNTPKAQPFLLLISKICPGAIDATCWILPACNGSPMRLGSAAHCCTA